MNPDTPKDSPPAPEHPPKLSTSGLKSRLSSLNGPQRLLALVGAIMLALVLSLSIYQVAKEEAPAPTLSVPSQASVSITGSGLAPATITIRSGTQLTWTNQDTRSHQVAADPHPTHDSIDGFDSNTTLLPGDSISYTFETKGSFSYHDQLNPLKATWQGMVVVE